MLAGGFLSGALRIPSGTPLWSWYDSPGLMPALLAIMLLFEAFVLMVRSWRRSGGAVAVFGGVEQAQSWGMGRAVLALAFCVGFVALMGRMSFGLLVAVFVFGMALGFRALDPLRAALLAVATAVGVIVVFGKLFLVPLP